MALFISPARKRFDENQPLYYPLGRALTRNALKDFKGSKRKETKVNIIQYNSRKDGIDLLIDNTFIIFPDSLSWLP